MLSMSQSPDGSVRDDSDSLQVRQLMQGLETSYRQFCTSVGGAATQAFEMFETDMSAWRHEGLRTVPDFSETHASWSLPSEDALMPYLAPQRVPNSYRGNDFVFTFAAVSRYEYERSDCQAAISEAIAAVPDPREVLVVDAPYRNASYTKGDGSVLFSELIRAKGRNGPQKYGAFIVNDFRRRFTTQVIDGKDFVTGVAQKLRDESHLSLEDERAVWLQVHDVYHDVGNLPHSKYLAMKMKLAPAALDELKADSHAYLALQQLGEPWQSAGLRQLVDKMLRFPFSPYGYRSVDAIVGETFLRHAVRMGAIESTAGGIDIDTARFHAVVEKIGQESIAVETVESPEDYLDNCREYLLRQGLTMGPDRMMLVDIPVR